MEAEDDAEEPGEMEGDADDEDVEDEPCEGGSTEGERFSLPKEGAFVR